METVLNSLVYYPNPVEILGESSCLAEAQANELIPRKLQRKPEVDNLLDVKCWGIYIYAHSRIEWIGKH